MTYKKIIDELSIKLYSAVLDDDEARGHIHEALRRSDLSMDLDEDSYLEMEQLLITSIVSDVAAHMVRGSIPMSVIPFVKPLRYRDYETDNRDMGETWLHIEDVGTVEVRPEDLYHNAVECAYDIYDPKTKDCKDIQDMVDFLTDIIVNGGPSGTTLD